MSNGVEFAIGMLIGAIPLGIFFYFKFRCKHEWEDTGELKKFNFDGDQYPIKIYDLYKCKKCKKNKRELR